MLPGEQRAAAPAAAPAAKPAAPAGLPRLGPEPDPVSAGGTSDRAAETEPGGGGVGVAVYCRARAGSGQVCGRGVGHTLVSLQIV